MMSDENFKPGMHGSLPWGALPDMKREQAEKLVKKLLTYVGDDPKRDGLQDTPKRVVKSWKELYGGYGRNVKDVLTVFDEDADEMVVLRDIEFFSTCEHHMLPFFGKAHIAYLPNGRIVGISKLARILEVFSRRLQVQERIGKQVADAIMEHLEPYGCAVVLEAKHFCMVSRGVGKQNSIMTTSALAGAFKSDPAVRDEFLRMIGK